MLQRILEHAGRLLPEAKRFPTERRLRGWLEQQRLDRADYAVVSFGKSGRTWLRVMISRIYQRRHGLVGRTDRIRQLPPRQSGTAASACSPTTTTCATTPATAAARLRSLVNPVLLLVRHPADITMSQYFQWKHRMRPHKVLLNQYPPVDDSVTPYQFMMGSSGLPKVNAWLNEWAAGLDSLDSTLVVRYEDMRRYTAGRTASNRRLHAHERNRRRSGRCRRVGAISRT